MPTEVGSAYARFSLDIAGLSQGIRDAKKLLGDFKKELEQDIVAQVRVKMPDQIKMPTVVPAAGPGSGGAGAGGVGGAAAGNKRVADAAEEAAKQTLRLTLQTREYAKALAQIDVMLQQFAGNAKLVNDLTILQAQVERQHNNELTKTAIFMAESAQAAGDYDEALVKIASRLQVVNKDTDEWMALVRSARRVMSDQTKEINANSDALIDNAKKRGEFGAALGLNQAAQQATTDPGRLRTLRAEEIDILKSLAKEQRALTNEKIDAALAEKDYFTAVTLVNQELGKTTNTVQQEIALRELLTKITRAETEARYDEIDAQIALKKQQGDTLGAFRAVAAATGEAQRAGTPDPDRLLALQRERIKLGQQLTAEQRAEADAAIRATMAQRDYWEALKQVQIQLELVDQGSVRFSQLKAQEADLVRKIGHAMDDEAIATAHLQQSQSQHAAAIQTLRDAMGGLSAGTERHTRLQQELTNTELRARAVSESIADTITAQFVAQKKYQEALDYNTAKARQVPTGPAGAQRREDLALERIQITNAQNEANARLAQSEIQLFRQLDEFAGAIAKIEEEQLKYNKNTKEWIDLEKQRRAILQQSENEARKDADMAFRAALATKRWAEAQAILNKELSLAQGQDDTRREDQISSMQARLNKAQGGGFFADVISGATKIIAPLTAGYLAFTVFTKARDTLVEGSRVAAELELERRSVQAMVDSVHAGNTIFDQAIKFGQKYAQTQEEMGKAADEAGIILRTTTSDASKVFEVLARLQTRAPGKDFGDAVRSITELQAGQLQSIERVFNVPQQFAQRLSDAIKEGQDPIEALDATLNQLGQTSDVLAAKLTGPAKQFRDLAVAAEGARISLGKAVNAAAGPVAEGIATVLTGYNDTIDALLKIKQLEDERREAARLNAGGAPGIAQTGQQGPRLFGPVQLPGLPQWATDATNKVIGLINAYQVFRGIGGQIDKELKEGFDASRVSIEQLRDIALKAQPALQGLLPGTRAAPVATPAVDQVARVNALINQANEGTISLNKLAEATRQLTGLKFGDDFLGVIQRVNNETPVATERLAKLQQELILLNGVMQAQQNPQLAARYIPEILAIENQLAVLQAQSPIEITIQMRVEQMGAVTQSLQAITQQMAQVQKQITDSNIAIKKGNDDFARQQHYADVDHYAQMNQAREDFNRNRARSDFDWGVQRNNQQRDFNIQLARSDEDHARDVAQKKLAREKEEARAERDFLYERQKARRDFDIETNRNTEDFELDRRKLLAEGRIKEAQLLTERFNLTQRRRGEDFGRGQSDAGDAFSQQKADRKAAQEEQDKQEEANYKRERDRRLADYAQQRADAQAAHDLANQRQSEDFERQQKAQEAQYVEQRRRQQEQHFLQNEAQRAQQTAALESLRKFEKDQQEILEQAKRDQLTLLALRNKGFTEEEAKAIIALTNAQTAFEKQMAAFNKTAMEGGSSTALAFISEFAHTLLAGIKPAVEDPLMHYGDYLKGKSPPPKGPLHDIDVGARKVAEAWTKGFGKGLSDTSGIEQTLRMSGITPQAYAGGGSGTGAGGVGRHITVTVPVGLTVDGKSMGEVVAPHVATQFVDDLAVSVQVVDASQKIELTQSSFRGGPSSVRK